MPWRRLKDYQKQRKSQAHLRTQKQGASPFSGAASVNACRRCGGRGAGRPCGWCRADAPCACSRLRAPVCAAQAKRSEAEAEAHNSWGGAVGVGENGAQDNATGQPQAAQTLEPHSIGGGWGGWAWRSRSVAHAPRTRRSQAPLQNKNGPAPVRGD